jgi:hypothetical protein
MPAAGAYSGHYLLKFQMLLPIREEVDRKKMALITADALKLKIRSEKLGGGAGDHKRWMECTFVMGGGGIGSSNNT